MGAPHSRTTVKHHYRVHDGHIAWTGEAICSIAGQIAERKSVSGTWKGEVGSVIKGGNKVETEACHPCKNKHRSCKRLASQRHCKGSYEKWMMRNCPAECDDACFVPPL